MLLRSNHGSHLSLPEMVKAVPAIAAKTPGPKTSERYAFFSTQTIVEAMLKNNIRPVQVAGRKTNTSWSRHQIRFQFADGKAMRKVGDSIPEIVLDQDHNGGGAFRMMLGIYELVCTNGLVVCSQQWQALRIRHSNKTIEDVLAAAQSHIESLPKLTKQIGEMKRITLSEKQQQEFGRRALALRWDPEERKAELKGTTLEGEFKRVGLVDAPVSLQEILTPRRPQDADSTLWKVFNRVQENLISGVLPGRTTTGRAFRVTPITRMGKNTELNSKLWELAEEYT